MRWPRTSGCCVSMPDGKLRSTRRRLLGGLAGVGMAATAGCLGTLEAAGFQQESAWRDPPLVEDRPNAVYLPAITEGMKMYGMTTSGPYGLAVMYSYPHRFWTVTGDEVGKTVVEAHDSIHLMVSLWDKETGTTLPIDSGITIEITNDDGLVTQEVAYPMLSQQMGLHYGANYELSGEGSYTATVRVGGVPLRRTGTLSGRLESVQTAAFDFEFDTDDLHDVSIREVEDAGSRGAVSTMEMDMKVPLGRAPSIDSMPGTHFGRATSGDALFDAFIVEQGSRFDVHGPYVYLSARTPYNQIVLPMMGLTLSVRRDGTTVLDRRLERTLDPEAGYHYGTGGVRLTSADDITITIDVPPQVARHDGYETAFIEMDPVSLDSR